MGDFVSTIEAQALRSMQAWMNSDSSTLKKLLHRDFTMMIGTTPPQLLDRPSLLAATERGLDCTGFRLGKALIERHGKTVWWSSGAELDLKLGRTDWSGPFLISDLWYKFAFGGWKLVQRSLSPTVKDPDQQMSSTVRQLQLWR